MQAAQSEAEAAAFRASSAQYRRRELDAWGYYIENMALIQVAVSLSTRLPDHPRRPGPQKNDAPWQALEQEGNFSLLCDLLPEAALNIIIRLANPV